MKSALDEKDLALNKMSEKLKEKNLQINSIKNKNVEDGCAASKVKQKGELETSEDVINLTESDQREKPEIGNLDSSDSAFESIDDDDSAHFASTNYEEVLIDDDDDDDIEITKEIIVPSTRNQEILIDDENENEINHLSTNAELIKEKENSILNELLQREGNEEETERTENDLTDTEYNSNNTVSNNDNNISHHHSEMTELSNCNKNQSRDEEMTNSAEDFVPHSNESDRTESIGTEGILISNNEEISQSDRVDQNDSIEMENDTRDAILQSDETNQNNFKCNEDEELNSDEKESEIQTQDGERNLQLSNEIARSNDLLENENQIGEERVSRISESFHEDVGMIIEVESHDNTVDNLEEEEKSSESIESESSSNGFVQMLSEDQPFNDDCQMSENKEEESLAGKISESINSNLNVDVGEVETLSNDFCISERNENKDAKTSGTTLVIIDFVISEYDQMDGSSKKNKNKNGQTSETTLDNNEFEVSEGVQMNEISENESGAGLSIEVSAPRNSFSIEDLSEDEGGKDYNKMLESTPSESLTGDQQNDIPENLNILHSNERSLNDKISNSNLPSNRDINISETEKSLNDKIAESIDLLSNEDDDDDNDDADDRNLINLNENYSDDEIFETNQNPRVLKQKSDQVLELKFDISRLIREEESEIRSEKIIKLESEIFSLAEEDSNEEVECIEIESRFNNKPANDMFSSNDKTTNNVFNNNDTSGKSNKDKTSDDKSNQDESENLSTEQGLKLECEISRLQNEFINYDVDDDSDVDDDEFEIEFLKEFKVRSDQMDCDEIGELNSNN